MCDLEALLAACRARLGKLPCASASPEVFLEVAPLCILVVKAYCRAFSPFLPSPGGGDADAAAYAAHFRRWLATFLPLAELHQLDPNLFAGSLGVGGGVQ